MATLSIASVFVVRAERKTWSQNAIYPATTQASSTIQPDARVIFVSGKQINSEIHKVPEIGAGTFHVELMDYNAKTGGVDVLRRTKPYRAEVHKRLVDMWYVIEGEGTLVTGGSLSQPIQTEADEFRGQAIVGGEDRHIGPGDFVRIPAGVPHWVSKVDGTEIIYLVVKTP